MPDVDEGRSTDAASRISRLERKVRRLGVSLFLFVAASVAVLVYDSLAMRRAFVTRHLFTREFNVPPPSEWPTVSVIGGLAPAIDGKSIVFWLAGDPLSPARHQTRISLDDGGGQRVEMIDRGFLRLATTADEHRPSRFWP
jgi:hypothetical protein